MCLTPFLPTIVIVHAYFLHVYLLFQQAVDSMTKYGRTLVKVLPAETTNLLIALCTDWPVDKKPSLAPDVVTPDGPPVMIPSMEPVRCDNPSKFIPIFVDKKDHLMYYLEEMTRVRQNYYLSLSLSLTHTMNTHMYTPCVHLL